MNFPLAFSQYKLLFATLRRDSKGAKKKAEEEAPSKRRGLRKTGFVAAVAFAVLFFVVFESMYAMQLALSAYEAGAVEDTLYVLIAATQLIVLFFGIVTTMGYLYFSRDKVLLQTLPFEKGVVFAVKETQAYLAELGLNLAVMLPVSLVYGITLDVVGYDLPWSYYLVSVFAVFMTPAFPMLVITLLSVPVMRLVSLFKKRRLGNGIALAVLYVVCMAGYFVLMGLNSGGEEITLGSGALSAFAGIRQATIFNYPIVNAMLGNSVAANFFIYLAGILVLFALSVALSLLFYSKTVMLGSESASGSSVKNKKEESKVRTPVVSFFRKEFKNLINTPTLLMNAIISIVMPVLMMVFVRIMFTDISTEEEGEWTFMVGGVDMFMIAMVTMMCTVSACSSGAIAAVGFSLEGKNIYALKTLPISAKTLVMVKLAFPLSITAVQTAVTLVAFPLITGIHNPIAIVGLGLTTLMMGFMSNSMLLYTDLKNPNFTWNNIAEITKNNKRIWKPQLFGIGFSILYLFLGMILALAAGLGEYAVLAIYYGSAIAILAICAAVAYRKLTERPEYYFEQIGG